MEPHKGIGHIPMTAGLSKAIDNNDASLSFRQQRIRKGHTHRAATNDFNLLRAKLFLRIQHYGLTKP